MMPGYARRSSLLFREMRFCATVVAHELGEATLDQVAFAGLLAHAAKIMPILGTQKIERIKSAI